MTRILNSTSASVAIVAALALHACGRSHEPVPEGGTATVIEDTVFACVPPTAGVQLAVWFDTSAGGVYLLMSASRPSYDLGDVPPQAHLVPVSVREVRGFRQIDEVVYSSDGRVEATAASGHLSFRDEMTVTLHGRFTFPREDGTELVVVVDLPRVQIANGC